MMNKLSLFIIISIMTNFHSIHDLNNLKDEAENAFTTSNYSTAIKKYQAILEKTPSEACQLNLAHAYLLNKDTSNAIKSYQQNFVNQLKQSIAFSQLGVITFDKTGITAFQPLEKKQKEEVLEALKFFKNALKKDATNEIARYNYEVLKHLLELKEPEEQDKNEENQEENQDQKDNKNQDQQNQNKNDKSGQKNEQKNQQNQDNKENSSKDKSDKENKDGKEGENDKNQEKNQQNKNGGSQKEKNDKIIDERLEAQNMTKEQAQKLLNSTTQQETKYLQQIKKGGNKPKSHSKNDW